MINPGTVAAIAAALMAQGENLSENSEFFTPTWCDHRNRRIRDFVSLAWRIAEETERQKAPDHAATCAAHELTNR
jgi:hypothetical protein